MHLVVDGYGGDPEKLRDVDVVRNFLEEYPSAIGMTKISPPQVHTYRGYVPEDWGLSGFVLIAESHISIHTFPDRRYINVDIFSCKDFDSILTTRDVEKTFSLPQVKVWVLDRGIEHSTPQEAYNGMIVERANISLRGGSKDV